MLMIERATASVSTEIEKARQQFEDWRRDRKRGEPIPADLWTTAWRVVKRVRGAAEDRWDKRGIGNRMNRRGRFSNVAHRETLPDGFYRFQKVPPGKFAISLPNTETKERIVEVAAGTRVAGIDFFMRVDACERNE
jgi:hypothetical protein